MEFDLNPPENRRKATYNYLEGENLPKYGKKSVILFRDFYIGN
jgi:hypothetical protein